MMALAESTHIGTVKLRVASLDAATEFYGTLLGMHADGVGNRGALFRAGGGGHPLIELVERRGAKPQPAFSAGLYHTAFLLPGRLDLGRMLRRLAEARWPLQGASDHAVSEALYLADPDGNGVEIYSDRPRSEWPRRNGQIGMTTQALNVDDLLAASDAQQLEGWNGFPAGTKVGHVHLRVPSIDEARELLVKAIGFDVTAANYPGALFTSAGGYHHHVAANIWESRGAPALADDTAGLIQFEVIVPDSRNVAEIAGRAESSGVVVEKAERGVDLVHAGGIRVAVREQS